MKKVSLIIPCYNCSSTLRRCLDSVFSQTYKNIEVIAINDGSKDNTLAILQEYASIYPELKIIDKANAGVSAARNDGMDIATGEYIEFLDSDDNFLSNFAIESNVKLLEKHNVDVVIFNFVHPCFQTHLPSGVYNLRNKKQFRKYYQDFFFCSMPWNKLFKREMITNKYDESMAFAEDELFNLANVKNVKKVYITDEVMLNYYCAPVVTKEDASAINKLFVDDDFYLKKDTIWYKCIKNNEKRDVVFSNYFAKDYDELKFVRPFDFFFYDFAFMCHLNTSLETMKQQCVDGILQDPEFFKILKSKEQYGLELKSESLSQMSEYMNRFVEFGNKAFHMLRNERHDLKLYPVLFSIFGKCFFDTTDYLNDIDILAECMLKLEHNLSDEAEFVEELMSQEVMREVQFYAQEVIA